MKKYVKPISTTLIKSGAESGFSFQEFAEGFVQGLGGGGGNDRQGVLPIIKNIADEKMIYSVQ